MRDAIETPLIYGAEDVGGQSEGRVAKCCALSRGRWTVFPAAQWLGRVWKRGDVRPIEVSF